MEDLSFRPMRGKKAGQLALPRSRSRFLLTLLEHDHRAGGGVVSTTVSLPSTVGRRFSPSTTHGSLRLRDLRVIVGSPPVADSQCIGGQPLFPSLPRGGEIALVFLIDDIHVHEYISVQKYIVA